VVVTGSVEGTRTVGGLVGSNQGTVTDSVSAADVRGADRVGGLVGTNAGPRSPARGPLRSAGLVTGSAATGDVTGERDVGGLVGQNARATVVDSAAAGDVDGGEARVGGLVGMNDRGTVIGSVATGDVTGGERTGGLVGYSLVGDVVDAAAGGDVTGGERTGGLVGHLEGSVLVGAAATGNVTGDAAVGGLVGHGFDSTTSDSYARGAVTGVDDDRTVGGLAGELIGGSLHGTYATGLVANRGGGGLVGRTSGEFPVVDSYWDREATTRLGSSGGGTRLDTARMTGDAVREHMPGLDVPDDWHLTQSYPVLAWEGAGPFLAVTLTEVATPVPAGDRVVVDATVSNYGGTPGSGTVALTDAGFGGRVRDATDVSLDPGESTAVRLAWRTRPGDAGVGTVTVATANDSDAPVVRVVDGPLADWTLVNVTVAGTPTGLREYDVEIHVPGREVTAVTPVLIGGLNFQVREGGAGTDRVRAYGFDVDRDVGPFADARTLYAVNVSGDVGAHEVELTVRTLRDGDDAAVNTSLVGVELTRGFAAAGPFDGPVPGVDGRTPTDRDGDGRYEDVNGDGVADLDDVFDLAFADHAAINAVPARREALDFDGSGAVDVNDAFELAFAD
jgi:hypothetical protein